MKFKIHRGTHEIGGSCVEIESNGSRIVVDIGMPLVDDAGERFDEKKYKGFSGPELVDKKILPDINGVYGWDLEIKAIDGLLISHSHSDHYGFYGYLRDDLQYYLGEGTRRIIDLNGRALGSRKPIANCNIFSSGQPFKVGNFTVTPYLMDHSAFDAYAFLTEADGKKLLYSGDFREHGGKPQAFEWFLRNAPRDVDALLLEGTMVGQKERATKTEKNVGLEIQKILSDTSGIVLIMMSAHNIDRIVAVYNAAHASDRDFLIDVYTANVLSALGELGKIPDPLRGFERLKVFYPGSLTRKLGQIDEKEFLYRFTRKRIKAKDIEQNPGKYIMIVRPTMLSDLKSIKSLEGATVIYSMWKGYLEEGGMKRFLKFMEEKNMKMVPIHTGGHADVGTLKKVVDTLKPKKIIPIHTFKPDMYEKLFPNVVRVMDREIFRI